MRRSPFLAYALLALGASLPAACTQNFDVFGTGGTTTTTTGSTSSTSSSSTTTSSSSTGCMGDGECLDTNPCTDDTCNTSTGECVHANKADGAAPEGWTDQLKDCKKDVCQGGQQTTVADDSDVPDGDTCLTYSCDKGNVQPHNTSANTPCGGGGLKCDGKGNCVGCVDDGDCPDPGTCKKKHCATGGVCTPALDASGTHCGPGGNNVCDATGNCVECVGDGDCGGFPQICVSNQCQSSCNTGKKDGDETDQDCGGSCTTKCGTGDGCGTSVDCVSKVCSGTATNKTCQAPTCTDNVTNGTETDKDCGGSCPGCASGLKCATDPDCSSAHCYVTGGGTGQATCHANLCFNNALDTGETDVDCGGTTCSKCANNQKCLIDGDCTSTHCYVTGGGTGQATCHANLCANNALDSGETDVDCGGTTCSKCADGKNCSADTDCTSGHFCYITGGGTTGQKTCHADLCTNGVKDGTESDIDCGGSCAGCGAGKTCTGQSDCAGTLTCGGSPKTCN